MVELSLALILKDAEARLTACDKRVQRQKDLIQVMKDKGCDTTLAEVLLHEFEKARSSASANRNRLLAELLEPH